MENTSVICPLCNDKVDKLLYRFHLDGERQVLEQIRQQNPEWTIGDGLCSRCLDYYHTEVVMQQRALPGIGPYFPVKSVDDFIILPTALRLDTDQRYTGKGVTICFIDSGFYPHPDLIKHRQRIKAIIDITDPSHTIDYFDTPHPEAWHGTMTTVACAGDGYLSKGLYKGIACNAELVLLKVQDAGGRITTKNIELALEWLLKNHSTYNIRIVNISAGADEVISYQQSRVDSLAEQLIAEGVVVVAAAGNDDTRAIRPPANSPSVITVGGLDDHNDITRETPGLYHSSFSSITEALMKPELIAPAIWIAAPILPGTNEKLEAETLHYLLEQDDEHLAMLLPFVIQQTQLDQSIGTTTNISSARNAIRDRIQQGKYISSHYMHVDGTSFAAPLVSAVIAQLLEVNPALTPSDVRQILFATSKRISSFPAERQGYGVIHPRKAILYTMKYESFNSLPSPAIDLQQRTIAFYIQHDCASQVSLAGSFNHWAHDILLMEPGKDGLWKIEIPLLPAGRYQYKFLVNEKDWVEDINNPYREPDGFSGFNSILTIGHN